MNHYGRQQRQRGFELLPYPGGQHFAGRILQPRNVVEIVMVQAVVQGLERGFDVTEVHHPARLLADLPADVDFDAERVTVQSGALVSGWHLGQTMRGFDGKCLENVQCGRPIRYMVCKNVEMLAASRHCKLMGNWCGHSLRTALTFEGFEHVPSFHGVMAGPMDRQQASHS